jgi:hypothetical protein
MVRDTDDRSGIEGLILFWHSSPGRKRAFLISIAAFGLTSLICRVAENVSERQRSIAAGERQGQQDVAVGSGAESLTRSKSGLHYPR